MMREGGLFITHMRMLISMSVFWIILDETSLQGIAQRTENEHMGGGGGGGGEDASNKALQEAQLRS